MAEHRRISPKFWQDPKVRAWGDQEKLLALYLQTCPHRNTEGLFWLPLAYIAADLGYPIDTVSKGLQALCEAGFATYDEPSETVLLRKSLKYQSPAGEKQITGALNTLSNLPPTPLFALLRDSAEQFAPEFGKALREALEDGILKHHGYPSDTPSMGYRPSSSISSSFSNSSSSSILAPAEPSQAVAVEHHPANGSRPPDLLFEAVCEACSIDWRKLTKSGRGMVNRAVGDLRQVGAKPEEVHERALAYRVLYPEVTLTPPALSKHWASVLEEARRVVENPGRQRLRAIQAQQQAAQTLDQGAALFEQRRARRAGA